MVLFALTTAMKSGGDDNNIPNITDVALAIFGTLIPIIIFNRFISAFCANMTITGAFWRRLAKSKISLVMVRDWRKH